MLLDGKLKAFAVMKMYERFKGSLKAFVKENSPRLTWRSCKGDLAMQTLQRNRKFRNQAESK